MDGPACPPPESEGSALDLGGVAISASAARSQDVTDGATDSGAGTRGLVGDIAVDLAEA